MKRIICISGDAASGKTTAAKRVRDRLRGWRIVSTGGHFRDYCARNGIDPQQISQLGDDFHRAADQFMLQTLEKERDLIAEARLVGYLARDMQDALRVFCDCPLPVRAARYQQREQGYSLAEATERVAARDRADTENFRRLYGIDYHDPAYYHLVLDTSLLDPEQVADAILEACS